MGGVDESPVISGTLHQLRPFRALVCYWAPYPGRCPGLANGSLSGFGGDLDREIAGLVRDEDYDFDGRDGRSGHGVV